MVILLKNDFDKVLRKREEEHINRKLAQIIRFDPFKKIPNRRLRNTYRLFYDPKT